MSTPPLAPWTVRAAMFLVSMAALLLQISLTRVLSATASHHWAFAVIGLAMLGLAASASVLFVRRGRGVMRGLSEAAAVSAGGGIAAALCAIAYPASTLLEGTLLRLVPLGAMAIVFFGLFFCAGYVISFLLSEFAEDASNLYWLDLTGAAAGCLAVVPLLDAASPLATVAFSGAMLAFSGILLGGPRFWLGQGASGLAA